MGSVGVDGTDKKTLLLIIIIVVMIMVMETLLTVKMMVWIPLNKKIYFG